MSCMHALQNITLMPAAWQYCRFVLRCVHLAMHLRQNVGCKQPVPGAGLYECISKTGVDLQRRDAAADERGRLCPLVHKTQHFGQGAREVERRGSPEERPARGRGSAACCAYLLLLAPGVHRKGPRTGKSNTCTSRHQRDALLVVRCAGKHQVQAFAAGGRPRGVCASRAGCWHATGWCRLRRALVVVVAGTQHGLHMHADEHRAHKLQATLRCHTTTRCFHKSADHISDTRHARAHR